MASAAPPDIGPENPHVSSGLCSKRPGCAPAVLDPIMLCRSHHASVPGARITWVIDRSRALLNMPTD